MSLDPKHVYRRTLVCNFYGGPGTGKSTITADVFAQLKWLSIDAEIAGEYAKDKVWEGAHSVLDCQPYVFGKQLFRLARLNHRVQVVLTDSPILLSPLYDKKESRAFADHVFEQYSEFWNMDILLTRKKKYNGNGRMQTRKEAMAIDERVRKMLITRRVPYTTISAKADSVRFIVKMIQAKLKSST